MLENNYEASGIGEREQFGVVSVLFHRNSSHNSVLQEFIQKLAHSGFASEEEIRSEFKNLLEVDDNEKED